MTRCDHSSLVGALQSKTFHLNVFLQGEGTRIDAIERTLKIFFTGYIKKSHCHHWGEKKKNPVAFWKNFLTY